MHYTFKSLDHVVIVLWHVDPLLGGEREIGDCTAAVARKRSANNNRGVVLSARSAKQQLNSNIVMVFSARSEQKCYKQDS
jgi:hypothetical protein